MLGNGGSVGGMACEAGGVTLDRGSMGVACRTGKGMLGSGALGQGLQRGSGGDCPGVGLWGVLSPGQAGSQGAGRGMCL